MACVILADPPWKFLTWSVKGKGRSAEAWYDCMTLADIKALPVAQMAAPDSLLGTARRVIAATNDHWHGDANGRH